MGIPELWPFQAAGLAKARDLISGRADGVRHRAALLVGPTGMGKTTVASEAARGRIAKGGRVVVIAHRRELIKQMAERLILFGLDVGYFGERSSASVQVTSIQEILASRRMPIADFVIVDEAHHYVAGEWSVPIREYLNAGAIVIGLTATPERADGIGLGINVGGIFDCIVTVAQVRDLIAINAVNDTQGITPIEIIEPRGNVRHLAEHPFKAWKQFCEGHNVAVFAPNLKNAVAFAADFEANGIEARIVDGSMAKDERDLTLERFASGDLKIILNVGVLTEGWDAPICDAVIVARKCGSFSLLRQIIGRARRARKGKTSAIYVDLGDNVTLHGHPDSDIDYDLDEGMSLSGTRAKVGDRKCRVCGRNLVDDIAKAKAEDRELTHCPECKTKLSRIEVLTPEGVALARMKEDDARRRVARDTRVKSLATLYEREIRKNGKRSSAENAYKGLFRAGFPPTDVRVEAWRLAKSRIEGVAE